MLSPQEIYRIPHELMMNEIALLDDVIVHDSLKNLTWAKREWMDMFSMDDLVLWSLLLQNLHKHSSRLGLLTWAKPRVSPSPSLREYIRVFLTQNPPLQINEIERNTYPILFQSCSVRLAEFDGKCIQDDVLKMGFDSDIYIQNTLINMHVVFVMLYVVLLCVFLNYFKSCMNLNKWNFMDIIMMYYIKKYFTYDFMIFLLTQF